MANLAGEEIKNIAEFACFSSIDLCKATTGAGDGGELFILDIEDFGKSPAGGLKPVGFVVGVLTLGTLPLSLHIFSPLLCKFEPKRNNST